MAQGQKATTKVVQNNIKSSTVSNVVELNVVNDQLVPDANQVNPGVNSATNKN